MGMSFWLTGLVIALGALAGEVIWNVANRKRFATVFADDDKAIQWLSDVR